nr:hypothetical protein [Tanacetum cinerariifolium]
MANFLEDIQCAGSDTRPPMLDRTDFASWQQRIRLYCRGKENGVNILKSNDEGPYQMGTVRETLAESTEGAPQFGPERPRVYSDLTPEEKDRYNTDIWATNILLQGLPKDIYTLINHYSDAKDIWDNVKMLLEGSELTKEDQESQLYDDFEHFRQHKGESIHDYYGRFVIAVKLNRGLRDSNYDQLYAYLKQHETHAKENKMMLERFSQPTIDPLALMSNVSNPQHYSPSSSASSSIQVPQPLADSSFPAEDLIENLTNTLALLTQSCKTFLPQTNNRLRTSSNARNQATVQDDRVNCTQPKQPQNSKYYKDKMLLMQAQENGVALDAEQLLFLTGGQDNAFDDDVNEQPVQDLAINMDNVFQADDCDAFDSDVDEAPTAQTMFMANVSSADPVTDEARPSYDSDILSEVPDHDHYQDAACAHHEDHVMHDSVQLDHVVDSHADYTSDSNMIMYDQYVKDNKVPVVHSDVSSVPNDAFIMIYNDMCEPHAQSVSNSSQNIVVKNSLTAKLATYKEHIELTPFYKLQLASTINHNKSMVEEVTFLKKDFKQKENKYLEDFLDMKSLKEKVEDRLIKQDQSLQTVQMLCRPKPHYNELNKVVIGYKNPLCLTRAKQVQHALYNGHETIQNNHAPAIVHNTEDTLEIAEITRKKINAKMNDPKCVTRKVKIAPHDYSKENFLATFTPQKQLTPKIFWSNDIIKLKSEALKEQTKVSRPIKALTVEMKDVFEELEAEVAQYAVDRKHDAIEWKNPLIANDNLIAKCLSQEVFSVATNFELNVARLTEMHVANTTVEARCLALEAELANLSDKIFVIGKMQASLQGKDNVIRQLKNQLSQLQVTRSDTDRTLKVRTTDSQITKLTDQVTNLQAQNDLFMAENDKIK